MSKQSGHEALVNSSSFRSDAPASVTTADKADPLKDFRRRFLLTPDELYFDGNSLGALPKSVADKIQNTVEFEWGHDRIRSWNKNDWFLAPQRVGAKIARLMGASPDEVIVTDSTSINIYKLLAAALLFQKGRTVIVSEPGNFPTDLYMAQGLARLVPGVEVRLAEVDRLADAIDNNTAVLLLTHVHYKSGRRLDMKAITEQAHAKGALVLWDLSHSVGAMQIDMAGSGADMAVGCGYKYLNGGPGAPAFIYIAKKLHEHLASPLSGWHGHAVPFEFHDDYEPAKGIVRFLCGTPSIIALAALEEAVDLFLSTDMALVEEKSAKLSSFYIEQVEKECGGYGFRLLSPREYEKRGNHVSFAHPNAYEICQALIARGVIGDFRAPDALRLGFAALYNSFEDVWKAVRILREIMHTRGWDAPEFRVRAKVT